MNLKSISRLLGFTLLLTISLLNVRSAMAFNPDFGRTTILSPKEAAVLFTLYFSTALVPDKQSQPQKPEATYWIPTLTDVRQAQDGLGTYQQTSSLDPAWNRFGYKPSRVALTSDCRQYAGIIYGGKKYILVNGFLVAKVPLFVTSAGGSQLEGDLSNQPIYLSDGGSAFRAAYNIDTHRIEYLVFDSFVESDPDCIRL